MMRGMTRGALFDFMRKHRLGVVATVAANGEPESAVVGIAVSDGLEVIFDTIETARKSQNLRKFPRIAVVIGWDAEITVQLEGLADEPKGAQLDRVKEIYFGAYPDGRDRQNWPGMTYFRVRPVWVRYSDFNTDPRRIVEFGEAELLASRKS